MGKRYCCGLVLAVAGAAFGAGCSADVGTDEQVGSNEQPLFISVCTPTGATATATSQKNTTNTPAKAVDASLTTRWESAWKDDETITLDLKASMTVYGVDLTWEGACGKDYDIDVAAAAAGPWTNGIAVRGSTLTGYNELYFPNGAITGRFVRMHGLKRCMPAYGFSLFDFKARVGDLSCKVDKDGDQFSAWGTACGVCPASPPPLGDCDDTNASAKPSQTGFFSMAHHGSWDWNCDGNVEVKSTSGATVGCIDAAGHKTANCAQCQYSFVSLDASDCGQQRCSLQGTEQITCR